MNKKIILFILVVVVLFGIVYVILKKTNSNNLVPIPVGVIENQTPVTPLDVVTEKILTPIPSGDTVFPQNYFISINNFSFDQTLLNINKGDTVIWTNNDDVPHQIVGMNISSPILIKGQTYTHIFNEAGTIDYNCSIHTSMKGTIIVK